MNALRQMSTTPMREAVCTETNLGVNKLSAVIGAGATGQTPVFQEACHFVKSNKLNAILELVSV